MPSLLQLQSQVAIQPQESDAPVSQSFAKLTSALDGLSNKAFVSGQLIQKKRAVEDKQALQTSKIAAGIDIRDNINRIKEEHLDPKNFGTHSLGSFQNAAAGYLEGVMPSIQPENRAAITNIASAYVEGGKEDIRRSLRKVATSRMQADLDESYFKNKTDAENQAFEGDAISAAGINGQVVQSLNLALESGLISSSKFTALKEGLNKSLQEQTYLGDFHRALENDEVDQPLVVQEKFKNGDKYLKIFEDSKTTGLSPEEKERLTIKMRGILRQRKQSIRVRADKINEVMKDTVVQIQNGEAPEDVEARIAMVEMAAPHKADRFRRQVEGAKKFWTTAEAIRYEGIAQKNIMINRARERIDLTRPGAAERLSEFNQIEQENKKQIKEFKNNPAGYTFPSPEVQNAIKSYNDSGMRGVLSKEEDAKHLAQVTDQALLATQKNMGLTQDEVRVVPNDRAAFIAQEINARTNVAEQAAIIRAEADKHGKYSSVALRDLNRAGAHQASMFYNSMLNNEQVLSLIPDATDAWSLPTGDLEKVVKDSVDLKSLRSSVAEDTSVWESTLGNGATVPVINNTREQLYKLSLILARKMGKGDASKKATSVINSNYEYSSYNGNNFRVPVKSQVPISRIVAIGKAFQERLRNVEGVRIFEGDELGKNLELRVPPTYFPELSEGARQITYRSDLMRNSFFQNKADDSGMYLADGSGSPVKLKNGVDFSFSFSQLANPSSPINKVLNLNVQTAAEQAFEAQKQGETFSQEQNKSLFDVSDENDIRKILGLDEDEE